jgi:hypothetical protein
MDLNLNYHSKTNISIASIFVVVFLFITPSKAQDKNYVDLQTCTIQSFEGVSQSIFVLLDYNDRIKISCLKDTLCIYNSYGVEGKPIVLNKNLLEIIYALKVGSNIRERRAIFICVSGNKLHVPLHIESLLSSELTEVFDKRADSLKLFDEKRIYQVRLKLVGENKNDYKLYANIHDENVSKYDPSTNYNNDAKAILNFDEKENIFYDDYRSIDAVFTVWHPEIESEKKQHIAGVFPVVRLGKVEYYFINDEWFEKGGDLNGKNYLIGYAAKSD